jgi:DtxR family Mn-dependent transcriptional regulator
MGGGHFQEFEDEYLETLYEFHERFPNQRVRNGDLAKYLDVSPASATEMVQRLAKNGYVEYVPYKGAILTPDGLEHGMMMKRRHRLAEVLLTLLPFEGDVHETACRLEHAFDDDLEVCISTLLGNPTIDPSGRNIPPPNSRISGKIKQQSNLFSLKSLPTNQSDEVIILLTSSEDSKVLETIGISLGAIIKNTEAGFVYQGDGLQVSEELSERIILRCSVEE